MDDTREGLGEFPGTVTVTDWLTAPDGMRQTHLWCKRWSIVADRQLGERVRSSDGWMAVARGPAGEVLALIPGCRFHGFVRSERQPHTGDLIVLSAPLAGIQRSVGEPLAEGKIKKGGHNVRPATPRPEAPRAAG